MRRQLIITFTLFIFCSLFRYKTHGQILKYDTKITIASSKKSTERSIVIQVNNKSQAKLSEIAIGHSPEQSFELMFAKILDTDGNEIRKLKRKNVETRSSQSRGTFFEDNLVEEFNLYSSDYPYQIEYAYRLSEDEFVFVDYWHPLLLGNLISQRNTVHIDIPIDYEVDYSFSSSFQFKERTLNERRILDWSIDLSKAPKTEIFGPSYLELLPNISIVPLNFKYVVHGKANTWESFGDWQFQLNSDVNDLPQSEKFILDQLLKGIESDKDKVRTLYHYLQDNTQYINVDIAAGGLKSYPSSYVCRNKYGDCKALTTFMQSILRYAGIESYYSLINAGVNARPINKKLPAQQFNHALLMVPLGSDTFWLENTSSTLPFNYLGTFTQDRFALVISGNKSKLISTPNLNIHNVLCQSAYIYNILEDGDAALSINSILRGALFEHHRYLYSNVTNNEQSKELVRDFCPSGFEINEWSMLNFDRDKNSIEVRILGHQQNVVSKIGELLVVKPNRINIPNYESPSNRKHIVRIDCPVNQIDSVVYKFQYLENNKVELPDDIGLTTPFGKYTASYTVNNNHISMVETMLFYRGTYPLEDYPAFYSFVETINQHQKISSIVITP